MAENRDLTWKEKQILMYSEKFDNNERIRMGELFFQQERYNDALECFSEAGHKEGIIKLRESAVKSGNVFILFRTEQVLEDSISLEEWHKAKQNALENGMLAYAQRADEIISSRKPVVQNENEEKK